MGLDQYAWALDQRPEKPVDFKLPPDFHEDFIGGLWTTKPGSGISCLAQWRKHPNLHGFLREIYKAKGGNDFLHGEFSGPVVLDPPDLDALEEAVKADALPETTGFFFGESRPEDKETTLEFIKDARAAIADGKTVVYDSSW